MDEEIDSAAGKNARESGNMRLKKFSREKKLMPLP